MELWPLHLAARALLLALPWQVAAWLAPAPAAGAEPAGYSLGAAAGLFWHLELVGDDGVSSASDAVDFPCCAENDALALGGTLGIVDPSFTPHTLTHLLEPAPLALVVGALPVTLDLAGSLTWSPPSGPSLMSGQSAPMPTGPLTAALFTGTLTTPFDSRPFGRSLLQHTGGDTTLRRFSGGLEVGDPRLRLSSVSEVLDTLEVDEADTAGRVEMRNPWEAVLLVSSDVVEAGEVSYALAASAGLFWEITVSGDDGVLPPSSDTVFLFAGLDAFADGNTVGVVEPRFTPETVGHSVTASGLALQIGAHAVTLDVAGSLAWSPASGPALAAGQAAPMPTGDASTARFTGTLHTPFGALPFDVDLADHLGGDLALTNFSASPPDDHPWLRLTSLGDPLDTLEIDEGDVPGRVDMRNPYRAVLGSSGGVTWSISARLFFNDTFHDLAPSPPNGAARDVSWMLRSELVFNDVFYASDPSLLPGSVPALGPVGRGLLAALLLGAALGARRLREG